MDSSADKGIKWRCWHALSPVSVFSIHVKWDGHLGQNGLWGVRRRNEAVPTGRSSFVRLSETGNILKMMADASFLYASNNLSSLFTSDTKENLQWAGGFLSGAKSANVSSHLQLLRHWSCSRSVSVYTSVLTSPELWLPVCCRYRAARRYVQFDGSLFHCVF